MSMNTVIGELDRSIAGIDDEIASYRQITMFALKSALNEMARMEPGEAFPEIVKLRNELDGTIKAMAYRMELKRALNRAIEHLTAERTFENMMEEHNK